MRIKESEGKDLWSCEGERKIERSKGNEGIERKGERMGILRDAIVSEKLRALVCARGQGSVEMREEYVEGLEPKGGM